MLEAVSSMRSVVIVATFIWVVMSGQPVEAADVSLCSLFQHPEKYDGQEITMWVGYRAGFEWSELACAACDVQQRIWVDFDAEAKGVRKLKQTDRFDSLYRLRVRGVFNGKRGHYGHENGWDYLFLVREVLSAKRLWQMSPSQPKVPVDLEARACQP